MRVLLDTQVFLWLLSDDSQLSDTARRVFANADNGILLSVATVWEIVVKAQRGKLPFPQPAAPYIRQQIGKTSVEVLPISLAHTLRVEKLPTYHRDPFDRILLAQAVEERIPIMSTDRAFRAYPVEIIW